MILNSYAYSSAIRNIAPKTKLFLGAIPLVITLALPSFSVSLITLAVMSILSLRYTKVGIKRYLLLLVIPLAFLLVSVLTIIIGKEANAAALLVSVQIGGSFYGISTASLWYGMGLALRALSAVSCMYFIALTTTMTDILFTCRSWKIPAVIVSLAEMIYRYIFVLFEEAAKIMTAQKSRLGYMNSKTAIKSMGNMLSVLFLRTLKRSDNIYAALESRGYNGEIKALPKEYEQGGKWVVVAVCLGICLVAAALWERGLGA